MKQFLPLFLICGSGSEQTFPQVTFVCVWACDHFSLWKYTWQDTHTPGLTNPAPGAHLTWIKCVLRQLPMVKWGHSELLRLQIWQSVSDYIAVQRGALAQLSYSNCGCNYTAHAFTHLHFFCQIHLIAPLGPLGYLSLQCVCIQPKKSGPVMGIQNWDSGWTTQPNPSQVFHLNSSEPYGGGEEEEK